VQGRGEVRVDKGKKAGKGRELGEGRKNGRKGREKGRGRKGAGRGYSPYQVCFRRRCIIIHCVPKKCPSCP